MTRYYDDEDEVAPKKHWLAMGNDESKADNGFYGTATTAPTVADAPIDSAPPVDMASIDGQQAMVNAAFAHLESLPKEQRAELLNQIADIQRYLSSVPPVPAPISIVMPVVTKLEEENGRGLQGISNVPESEQSLSVSPSVMNLAMDGMAAVAQPSVSHDTPSPSSIFAGMRVAAPMHEDAVSATQAEVIAVGESPKPNRGFQPSAIFTPEGTGIISLEIQKVASGHVIIPRLPMLALSETGDNSPAFTDAITPGNIPNIRPQQISLNQNNAAARQLGQV